jgi:Alpha-kinase family
MDEVYEEGIFKTVYLGEYTEGPREGQQCVSKVMRSGATYDECVFDHELAVVAKAQDLLTRFNDAGIIDEEAVVRT